MSNCAPVFLIFFNRPDTLKMTFDAIKKAKPRKLYLAQDGARKDNENDQKRILECRKIVENIDWDCEVYKNYSEQNNGCGKGPERAINWFFDNEEEGIILEDDCIASQSFFTYCTEMLKRYRTDDRIFIVTGCNLELQTKDVASSYFFGYAGTNWGWATWKRNWVKMDYSCEWIKDNYAKSNVQKIISNINKTAAKAEIQLFERTNKKITNGENISYWDVQWQAVRYLNHQLAIIPQKNLITNVGLGLHSTHAKMSGIPKNYHSTVGKVNFCYNIKYELGNELIHPNEIVENHKYDEKIYKALYPNKIKSKIKAIFRKIKSLTSKKEEEC